MSHFDEAFEMLIGHEGGYVNDPADPGGETKFGISKRSYPDYDIKKLTLDKAKAIYRWDYWNPARCDDLPPGVALVVFDAAVNSGVGQSVRWLQLAVDAQPDGVIGPKTLAAVKKSPVAGLIVELLEIRLAFMERLPTYSRFGRGWRNRIITLAMQAALVEDRA